MGPVRALGKVIMDLRKKHGFSQRQVANASRLSLEHFKKVEKGKQRSVTLPVLERIARVFGLKVHQVVRKIQRILKDG